MATPRETAAQRRQRYALLLADFDNRNREYRKLHKIVEGMKEQLADVPPGVYGDFQLSFSAGREIVDSKALKELHAKLKIEVPMTTSKPSVIVTPVVASGAKQ